MGRFASFAEFYPYYLDQHRSRANRRLHLAGQAAALTLLVAATMAGTWWLLAAAPVVGYSISWVGHFAFEGNRPATLGHPLYSLRADLVMCRDILTGRLRF